MNRGSTVRAAMVLALACLVGCVEGEITLPSCADGRSRCVADVSLGYRFGCARLQDRTVWCWGRNDEAQLGYSTTDLCPETLANGQTRAVACHTFPFQVVGLDRVVDVSAGRAFTCARRDDNTVRCWGSNTAGQLGNGLTLPSQTPVSVRGLANVTALAAGARHACALSNGRVFCWGANDRGQLGAATTPQRCATADGEIPCSPDPVEVTGLEDVVALTAGEGHTCARIRAGLALCWGDQRWAQTGVGDASGDAQPMPQAVLVGDAALEGVSELAARGDFACARTDDGAVWCWGRNDTGQLGHAIEGATPMGCSGPCGRAPRRVESLERRPSDAGVDDVPADVRDASADARDASADVRDGTAADASVDASVDVSVDASADATVDASVDATADVPARDAVMAPSRVPRAIAAGETFACATLEDGTVRCWGDDREGQLGDGRRVREAQGVVMVIATPGAAATNPLQSVVRVVAGSSSACALLGDGSLRCWGSNEAGALGNGTTSVQSGPVPVTW